MDTKLEKRLKPIHTDIKKLRKDLTTTINFFDNRNLELEKDINRTRKELTLQEMNKPTTSRSGFLHTSDFVRFSKTPRSDERGFDVINYI